MVAIPSSTHLDRTSRVTALRSQHGEGLLGTPGRGVRLTWRVTAAAGLTQLAYQLASGPAGDLVPASVTEGSAQVAVPAGDVPAGERRAFAVRIATENGWTDWSDELVVEAGLDSYEAAVIGIPSEVEGPAAILRREFTVDALPTRAR